MTMQAFTKNVSDNSTEQGFQFTFHCDNCQDGYKTKFADSKTAQKANLMKGLSSLVSMAATMTGKYNVGYSLDKGIDVVKGRFAQMSPEWQKEHDAAFEKAINEAKGNFKKCPNCNNWVCETCWNEQDGLCTRCSQRENVMVSAEVAAAKRKQVGNKAAEKNLYSSADIETKVTSCSKCGKPFGKGKFCVNCGAAVGFLKCKECGAKNVPGTNSCGECGKKLA